MRRFQPGCATIAAMNLRLLFTSSLALALVAGCGTPPATNGTPAAPAGPAQAGEPFAWYRSAAEPVYRIDPARSLIAVTVRRGGPFARFGHDHVVASRTVQGFAAPRAGRADFQFRLDELTVDEPELRRAAGLDTEPSPDAIAGTRANMLGKVLDAERFPLVQLRAERIAADPARLKLAVTLHGTTRSYEVPTVIETGSGTLAASGELRLRQSDFGITPLSILGGAISVQDALDVRFSIVARSGRAGF